MNFQFLFVAFVARPLVNCSMGYNLQFDQSFIPSFYKFIQKVSMGFINFFENWVTRNTDALGSLDHWTFLNKNILR